MCVIIYKPKKAYITKKVLSENWRSNPDGGGFMFADNDILHIHKGFMTFRKFYKKYRECENKYNTNFVIHFRIGTHGKINPISCHPFYVNKDLGFAHNGILHCIDVPKNSNKSDTMIFNETVLKDLPKTFMNKKSYRILLEAIAKKEHSKFVFMTNKGVVHIINESAGHWEDGMWFSCAEYKSIVKLDNIFKYEPYDNEDKYSENWIECYCCGDYYPESECCALGDELICAVCANEAEKDHIFR